jgi:hypothetical protein
VRKINKELWLLLSLVLIAAMIHFLAASQAVVLVFFFLPNSLFGISLWQAACHADCLCQRLHRDSHHLYESRGIQSSVGLDADRQPLV